MRKARSMWPIWIVAAALGGAGAGDAVAADLTVEVKGLRNADSQVLVALHQSAAGFPSRWNRALAVKRMPAAVFARCIRRIGGCGDFRPHRVFLMTAGGGIVTHAVRELRWFAALAAMLAAVFAAAIALDDRVLANGEGVWLKPIRFSLAFATHAATVAWLAHLTARAAAGDA
jgi:hypothetical protein